MTVGTYKAQVYGMRLINGDSQAQVDIRPLAGDQATGQPGLGNTYLIVDAANVPPIGAEIDVAVTYTPPAS